MAFAARGQVADGTFVLGVGVECAHRYARMRVEDRLLAEARSLIDRAQAGVCIIWGELRFANQADFYVWEKTLTPEEVDRLMES